MKTLTAEQFQKLYGKDSYDTLNKTTAVSAAPSAPTNANGLASPQSEPANFFTPFKQLGSDIGSAFSAGKQQITEGIKQVTDNPNPVQKAEGALSTGAGVVNAASSVLAPVMVPFIEGVKKLVEPLANSKSYQDFALSPAGQLTERIVNDVNNLNTIVGAAAGGAEAVRSLAPSVKSGVVTPKTAPLSNELTAVAQKASAGIMNKVARLNPADITEFKRIAGKTPGEYLSETGNFGTPDQIITTEAEKFNASKSMVDNELAKLPGVYKSGAISDALNALSEKARTVSSENVPATYRATVQDLIKKYNAGGLNMGEINLVKRLFERNVKLGYNKLLNADKIEQATNIDSAIRSWQVQKAKDLGFTNISELNKQTQISKFIVNKLADKVIGQSALNSVSLTDWIVLGTGPGSPGAIAGFLTKRFFSSRTVQAKIAQLLNVGEPVKGIIKPQINPTIENTLRQQFPQGTLPELPPGRSPVKQDFTPIEARPASSVEAPAQSIANGGAVKTSSTPVSQPEQAIGKETSLPNTTIKSNRYKGSQGGYVNAEKIISDVKAFLKKEPPYGLLKDLENFRDLYDFGTMPKGETNKLSFMKEVRTQLDKRGVDAFNMTDRAIANFADEVLNQANKAPK